MKTKTFKKLYHQGSLNINDKKNYNLEGNHGLSVCNIPNVWNKITPLSSSKEFVLTKSNNSFLDFHELNNEELDIIYNWGIENDYLKETNIYVASYYDEDMDQEMEITFYSKNEALEEYEDSDIKQKKGYVATEKFSKFNGYSNKDNIDLIVVPFVKENTDLDGVFWNDTLDISRYSAPRLIIIEEKLNSWKIKPKRKIKKVI